MTNKEVLERIKKFCEIVDDREVISMLKDADFEKINSICIKMGKPNLYQKMIKELNIKHIGDIWNPNNAFWNDYPRDIRVMKDMTRYILRPNETYFILTTDEYADPILVNVDPQDISNWAYRKIGVKDND